MTPALTEMGTKAVEAARTMATLPGRQRANALRAMSAALPGIRNKLQQANEADISEARSNGLADPLIARLAISDKIFAYMQNRLNQVWSRVAGGCQINRPIDALIEAAGFSITSLDLGYLVDGPRMLTFHYDGRASRG